MKKKAKQHKCERCGLADETVRMDVAQQHMNTVTVWVHPSYGKCIELLREELDYYKEKLQRAKSERD